MYYIYKYSHTNGYTFKMAEIIESDELLDTVPDESYLESKVHRVLGRSLSREVSRESQYSEKELNVSIFKTLNKSYSQESTNGISREDFIGQLLRVKNEINVRFEDLLCKVEQRKNELLTEIENLANDFMRNTDKFEKERRKINDVISKADELGNESVDLRDKINVSSRRRMSQLSREQANDWDVDLIWREYSELIENLGEIKVTQTPNYLVRNEHFSLPVLHGKQEKEMGWATGICLDSSNLYVADSENNCIQIYTQDGGHVNQLRSQKMNWPWGICTRDEIIYVTLLGSHSVAMFNLKGDCLATCGGKGSGSDKLNKPSGLDVFGSDLFVCDQDNHRVQVFDSRKLSHRRKITLHSSNHPNDCVVMGKELLVLTLSDPCMHSFTLSGELLRQFISWGPGKEVTSSNFFTVDRLRNIIIAELGGNCLKVFSYEGTFLSKITCNGALNQPRGIGLDQGGQIFVSHRGKVGRSSVILTC